MSSIIFVLESLDTGKKIEVKGIKFYTESSETVSDKRGQETLKFLANEEKEHLRFINNLLQSLKENEDKEEITRIINEHKKIQDTPKIFPDKESYEKQLKAANSDREILKEAKKVEKRSIDFYTGCKDKVDEKGYKEIFETMMAEENKHMEWIEMMEEYMDVHGYWHDLYSYFANE